MIALNKTTCLQTTMNWRIFNEAVPVYFSMAHLHPVGTPTNIDPTGEYRSHSISGGGSSSNEWAPYFGVTNKNINVGPYQRENYDLPDAYVGSNPFLSNVMIRTITGADTFITTHVLPFTLKEDSDLIVWDVLKFNNHLLNRRPEESVSRLVTTERQEDSDSFVTYGIAMSLESGFFRTAQGQYHYAMHLQQISNATSETASLGATLALLQAADLTTNGMLENDDERLSAADFRSKLQQERDEFGMFQTGRDGFNTISDRLRRTLKLRGVDAPTFTIVPAGSIKYVKQTHPDCATRVDVTSLGVLTESRSFALGEKRPSIDPFFRTRAIGSYYTALARDSEGAGTSYNTSLRTIHTWSEDDDDFHQHTLLDLIEASGITNSSIHQTHVSWFSRSKREAERVIRSMGVLDLRMLMEIIEHEDNLDSLVQADTQADIELDIDNANIQSRLFWLQTFTQTMIDLAKEQKRAELENSPREGYAGAVVILASQLKEKLAGSERNYCFEGANNLFLQVNADEVKNAATVIMFLEICPYNSNYRGDDYYPIVAAVNEIAVMTVQAKTNANLAYEIIDDKKMIENMATTRRSETLEKLRTSWDSTLYSTVSVEMTQARIDSYLVWLDMLKKPSLLQYLEFCATQNLYCPVSFLLLSPDMQFECGTMIMGKGGSELGATFYGFADFQLGKNAAQKMLFGHFTIKLKSVVINKDLLVSANDVYIREYVKGAGHTFNTDAERLNPDLERKDLYCHVVPPDWSPKSKFLDVTGRFNTAVYGKQQPEEMVPGLTQFAKNWNLFHPASYPYRDETESHANTIVWQGAQRVTRCGTDNVISPHMIVNSGHLGDMYPGCGGLRRGADMYSSFINYNNTVPQSS
jgi:hypothetical protein